MRKTNYKAFRKQLRLDFGDIDLKTKNELKILMRTGGYRKKSIKKELVKVFPTQKQLDFAWEFLKGKDISYKLEEFGRYRAERNIYIKGKLYKKGQFVPKR